jgi:hypothetical protein
MHCRRAGFRIPGLNQWRDVDGVLAAAGHEDEVGKVPQRISHHEDFGRSTAFRFADDQIEFPFCAMSVAVNLNNCSNFLHLTLFPILNHAC